MNTPKLPPLPKPDTHCFDEDTGKDVWSHSPEQMQAYALAAIQAQAQQPLDKVVFCTYPKCQTTGMRCAGPCSQANSYGQGVSDESALRAIEAAATEPLPQRIAELEKALKLVQQHHATAWNRGHIAGMAANRMVAQDALNAVKKDAWNNTQLTEALMAAEARCEELEQRNSDLYEDVQRFRKHAMNEKAARMELERQLEGARNQALEEAAKVCDVTPPQPFRPSIEAAHAIRALKGAKK